MRNLILAAVTVFAIASSAAPGMAADREHNDSSSNVQSQCDNILANKHGHSNQDVQFCASKQ